MEDVSITATYIMLWAIELGVYTTWCNYFANSKLEQAFDLPGNEKGALRKRWTGELREVYKAGEGRCAVENLMPPEEIFPFR